MILNICLRHAGSTDRLVLSIGIIIINIMINIIINSINLRFQIGLEPKLGKLFVFSEISSTLIQTQIFSIIFG